MTEKFISDPIEPMAGSFNTTYMSAGMPGLPGIFSWRGQEFTVEKVLKVWRTTKRCHHGSADHYARRHWFKIQTRPLSILTIYFDKGTHGQRKEMGWYLFSILRS